MVSYRWSAFSPSQAIVSMLQNKRGMLSCALNSPLCFYTLVFSGSSHNAFYQYEGPPTNSDALFRLTYKTKAIKMLREEIERSDGHVSDEILLCMILLASQANSEKRAQPEHTSNYPLSTEQDAQHPLTNEWEWSHMMALRRLITQRGGLHTIKIYGLAFAIASFDTHTALMLLTHPFFPPLMHSSHVLSTWSRSLDSSTLVLHSRMMSGFDFLADSSVPAAGELHSVLFNMRDVIVGLYQWQNGYKDAPDIPQIVWARNLNQHELLSLPNLSEQFASPLPDAKSQLQDERARQEDIVLYELCRLSTLAFQFLVLLPYLRNSQTPDRLSDMMINCLQNCKNVITSNGIQARHDLIFWATLLGGWLANRPDLRLWFAQFLANLIHSPGHESRTEISWELARIKMNRFLWLDSQCDEPCRLIWDEACQIEIQEGLWSCTVS